MFHQSFLTAIAGLLMSFNISATTFQALPLDKLVEESNSAAEVTLKEKKAYMNKMGMILTDYIFNVTESYNLDSADLDGEFLKITMTGGTVNGVTSFIDGAPDFAVGEKSFLLMKKINSKFYLSNFTMGKYKIQEEDGRTVYVSSVFPYDSDIGQVKKERMIEMIRTKFKIVRSPEGDPKIQPVDDHKSMAAVRADHVFEKRAPAQEDMPNASEDGLFAMWGFFALFTSTGLTMWWKLKKGVKV